MNTSFAAPFSPSWSPSGKRLSFFAYDGSQLDVFTIKLDGSGERNVTNDAAADFYED